jgi:AraC family transcriptional regulator of adaptative response / DNA-3-methyladenine glycosylase II
MQDITPAATALDPAICRQARLSRDPRFDGEFFFGVSSTGIYCRPICPARAPAEKNVAYFLRAAQAAQAGYRPCLRCRPESAPNSPAWRGTSVTVQRALKLIQSGALNQGTLGEFSARLGVGERYLRKLFQRELGVSPLGVALNQRLLFAKKLLAETDLPMTEVAYAAGFSSIRRFNSAVREHFRLAPGDIRKRGNEASSDSSDIQLTLSYRPPYDWPGVLDFFKRHEITGVERVSSHQYQRAINLAGETGQMRVSHCPQRNALSLSLHLSDYSQLMPLIARVRTMFDLDANPDAIASHLGKDSLLQPLLDRFPGVRSPGYWSFYEAAFRAIVGQQVSTAAARTVCARIAEAAAGDQSTILFPEPDRVAALPGTAFSMPGRRRDTLRALCAAMSGEEPLGLEELAQLRGVGPWTLAMVAMRGAGDPDVLPNRDLGLEQAWRAMAGDKIELQTHAAAHWRPWRSYAANLLWRSLSL